MADEPDCPPISFNRQIASLDVGASLAVTRRVPRSSAEAGDLATVKAKLRNSVNPAVSKARKKNDAEYETDTGEFLTQSGHVVVIVAVTRTS